MTTPEQIEALERQMMVAAMAGRDDVLAANMAELATLNPQDREVAITRMLGEARSWLAHSVEATEPTQMANFKAFVATVAESTKQLNLSKEIQLDATEMIRRAERGLGLAIRKGQDRGTVSKGSGSRSDLQPGDDITRLPSVKDIAPDFYNNGSEIGHLTDDFTDGEFETALAEAKDEGNVSRANVLRKGRDVRERTHTEKQSDKWDRVAEMAAHGHASAQIARELGVSEEGLRQGARDRGITIKADRILGNVRRLDMRRVVAGSQAVGRVAPPGVSGGRDSGRGAYGLARLWPFAAEV